MKFGMHQIILINESDVELNLLERVIEGAGLPESKILLILSDGYLPDGLLGCSLPRALVEYENSIGIFKPYLNEKWDCVVALSKKACDYRHSHEGYFVYLLGHELGHAHICICDITTHIFSCLIQSRIREASKDKVTQWHEIPHEKCFDQFGMFIAESLFSRDQIHSEYN
jgi:hypothetical protein